MAMTLCAVTLATPNYTSGLSPIWITVGSLKLSPKMNHGIINYLSGALKMSEKIVKYICTKCLTEEDIPQSIISYFHAVDPDPLFNRPPSFSCEKCGYPYMVPKDYLKKSSS